MKQTLVAAALFWLYLGAAAAQTPFGNPYLLSVRIQNQLALDPHATGSEPASPAEGWLIYNSTLHQYTYWNGTTWTAITGGGGGSLPDPVTVAHGGTGLTTLTAHKLYVGNGTNVPTAIATGNAGQALLSGGASADPTFADPSVSAIAGAFVDGWDATKGTRADTASCANGTTEISCFRQLHADMTAGVTPPGTSSTTGVVGVQGATGGVPVSVTFSGLDPCATTAKASVRISQALSTQIIIGTTAKKTYVCSISVVGSDAENISLVEGTGSLCATGVAGIIGGSTAATGMNLAASVVVSLGNGAAFVGAGVTNATNVCLLQSGTGRVAGVLTYVQA